MQCALRSKTFALASMTLCLKLNRQSSPQLTPMLCSHPTLHLLMMGCNAVVDRLPPPRNPPALDVMPPPASMW